jgi:hypothetical protein
MQIDTVITKISDSLTNQITIQYISEKSKLWGIVSVDVIITVSITILVFFLGIFGQYIFEMWKKNKYYKDIYDYFINNIDNAIDDIKKEEVIRNNAISYIIDIKNFRKYIFPSSLISFSVFYDISRNDLYKSFLKYHTGSDREDNKKIFLNIADSIKNIDRRKEDFAKINDDYNQEFINFMSKYDSSNRHLNQFKGNLEKNILVNQLDSRTVEFFKDIDNIYVDFRNNENHLVYDYHEIVIKKIIEITKNKYCDFIIAKDFGSIATDLNIYFNHIVALKKAYSKSLEDINININKWREILENKLNRTNK